MKGLRLERALDVSPEEKRMRLLRARGILERALSGIQTDDVTFRAFVDQIQLVPNALHTILLESGKNSSFTMSEDILHGSQLFEVQRLNSTGPLGFRLEAASDLLSGDGQIRDFQFSAELGEGSFHLSMPYVLDRPTEEFTREEWGEQVRGLFSVCIFTGTGEADSTVQFFVGDRNDEKEFLSHFLPPFRRMLGLLSETLSVLKQA